MALGSAPTQLEPLDVPVTPEIFPVRHAIHGTPHPVVYRLFTFTLPHGAAAVDHTDYGHPGRFNPCHPGQVTPPLQPNTPRLGGAAEALAPLLD